MRRRALVVVLLAAACTEELTTPGVCPEFCPPGEITVVDTLLADLVGRDSAFRGYVQPYEASVMLAADVPGVIDSRATFRTNALTSRIRLTSDTTTSPVVGVDSMRIILTVPRRDTSARGLALALYRLPLALDSTTTFADLAPAFAAPPIRVVQVDSLIALAGRKDTLTGDSVTVDSAAGSLSVLISLDSAEVGYTTADSARLALGIRASVDPGAGSGVASVSIGAGETGPVITWFAKVDSLGFQTVQRGLGAGVAFDGYVYDPPAAALDSNLAVGGAPSARSLVRFARPAALFDSAQIVRATLVLVPVAAAAGSPADSFRLVAQRVATDLGAKSPLAGPSFAGDGSYFGLAYVHPGSLDTVTVDITDMLRRWQADTTAPTALFLRTDPEAGILGEIRFAPSVHVALRPALLVTYVPTFPFGVP
ncbi:MAG TPA: hypothetical protein VD707_06900 [Gemmatimonadales bacterium]|jgi:hypothetical protein|nr:hypothetical protein [Gemmatimonadales bacterium]